MFLLTFTITIFLATWLDGPIEEMQLVMVSIGALVVLLLGWFLPQKPFKRLLVTGSCGIVLAVGGIIFYQRQSTTIPTQPAIITGQVVDIRKPDTYLLESKQGVRLLASEKPLSPGDQISAKGYAQLAKGGVGTTGEITALGTFDYAKRLYMKGYIGDFTATSLAVTAHTELPQVFSWKQKIRLVVHRLPVADTTAGLVMGILIGDRSLLPVTDYKGFIRSGLVHIIAVSGSNMIYLLLFGNLALFFLPYYTRGVVLGGALIGYAMLCGWDSSIFRATVMGLLALLTVLQGRYSSTIRLVALTFVGMLLWNPYMLLYDLGFLLSYAALLGVIYVTKRTQSWQQGTIGSTRAGRTVMTYFLPTLGATGGVLPVLFLFSDGYNLLSIVANFIVVPILPVLYIAAVGGMVVSSGPIGKIFLRGVDTISDYIFWVSEQTIHRGVTIGATGMAKVLLPMVLVGMYILIAWGIRKSRRKMLRR